jgi:hypothetical protein
MDYPVQSPFVVLSVDPTVGLPEMTGGLMLTGTPLVTTAVGLEVAVAEPAEFVAVTLTRSVKPASAATTV